MFSFKKENWEFAFHHELRRGIQRSGRDRSYEGQNSGIKTNGSHGRNGNCLHHLQILEK